jgi:hypothetical protein
VSADDRRAFEQVLSRVESLIKTLDQLPDAAAPARELVQVVLELHAAGLARLLEVIAQAESGQTLLARLAADDRIASLLLLHGLHPQGFEARVRTAVERLRPHLGVYGLRVTALDIAEDTVRLRVQAAQQGFKRPAAAILTREIEDAIFEAAPDATDVRIEGLETAGTVAFVPVASITRRGAAEPVGQS